MMTKTKDSLFVGGILINNAGKNRYTAPDSVSGVIKYIARQNGMEKDDLVCCGALGAMKFTDINITIRQFECVQSLYNRRGNFGRYIDHEIYDFTPEAEAAIGRYHIPIDTLARKMAYDFYEDGFQVYYGVHAKDEGSNRLHVHFAINTVNYRTRKKRHENKREVALRNQRLNQIVADEIEKYAKKY
jgi:hypothetical protein